MKARWSLTAVSLSAMLGTLAFGAAAHAASGSGDAIDIAFGAIDSDGALTFTGTYSCRGNTPGTLTLFGTQGTIWEPSKATGKRTIKVSCPATRAPLEGKLPTSKGSWWATGLLNWRATLDDPSKHVHQSTTATQNGLATPQTTQNVTVGPATATVGNTGITLTGTYGCDGTSDHVITALAHRVTGLSTSRGQITVSCPTNGPTSYTLTIPPLARGTFQKGETVKIDVNIAPRPSQKKASAHSMEAILAGIMNSFRTPRFGSTAIFEL